MGHFSGFQRCVLSHSYSSEVQKIPKVSSEKAHLPVHLSPFWFGNGPVGIHQSGQGSKTDGSSQGYRDPPVPRRLVGESPCQATCLQHTWTLLDLFHELGWVVNLKKSELTPQQVFNFGQLPVRPVDRLGSSHSEQVDIPTPKAKFHQNLELLHSQTIHVSDRDSDSQRIRCGQVAFKWTHSVASLACS